MTMINKLLILLIKIRSSKLMTKNQKSINNKNHKIYYKMIIINHKSIKNKMYR